jgi:hypothetical protein
VKIGEALKKEKQDPSCCLEVHSDGKIFICINIYGCGYEVKRLARFLRIECLLQTENVPDSRVRPHDNTLEKDFKDEGTVGRWEGWAFLYGVSN